MDAHDVLLHRAEAEARAMGSGGYRAGNSLAVARASGFQGERTIELGREDGVHLFDSGSALEVGELRRIGRVTGHDAVGTDRKIPVQRLRIDEPAVGDCRLGERPAAADSSQRRVVADGAGKYLLQRGDGELEIVEQDIGVGIRWVPDVIKSIEA